MTTCANCGAELRADTRFCVACGSRVDGGIPSAIRPPPAPPAWREPTADLPLRFGSHRVRHTLALALLFGGGALVQLGSVYTREALAAGVLASVAGWVIVPAPGWRRAVALGPAVLGVAALLNGAGSGALLVLTLAGWLLVRVRPALGYLALALPLAAALVLAQFFPQYDSRALVVVLMGVVMVVAAWAARSLAASRWPGLRDLFQRRHSTRPLK